jgi:hypothetical protein
VFVGLFLVLDGFLGAVGWCFVVRFNILCGAIQHGLWCGSILVSVVFGNVD